MFRRKADRGKSHSKGNVDDPFGLSFDPTDLKFDEAALEKELADIVGVESVDLDEEELKVKGPNPGPKIQPKKQGCDDGLQLLQQLQVELGIDDAKSNEKEEAPIPVEAPRSRSSFPPFSSGGEEGSSSPTTETNNSLLEILDRKSVFENVINSMKSSQNLSDVDRAYLHRCERLLDSINTMADQAKNNIPVDLNDLPPLPPPNDQPPAPRQRKTAENIVLDYVTGETAHRPSGSETVHVVKQLKARLMEYRSAVAVAEKEGNKRRATELMVAVNALVESIPQIESGVEEFDPDSMPPPPDQFSLPADVLEEVMGNAQSSPSTGAPPSQLQKTDPAVAALTKAASSTVVSNESLMARIQMLKSMIQGSSPQQKRMYERAMDNYSRALRAFKAGVHYDFGGLPPLPGCPQFTSVASASKPPAGGSSSVLASGSSAGVSSNQARTLELLQKRQHELRTAAARAKSTGDMVKAKEYLRSSLGMNNMIRSVQAGLPIDLKQLPTAPGAKGTNAGPASESRVPNQPILSGLACDPPVEFQTALVTAGSDPVRICDRLIVQLEAQVAEAETLSKEHREAGLSNLADKFYDLADVSRKWIALTNAYKGRIKVPDYTFEKANLSRLNMNPDLGDNVLEVTPVRGISFPVPPGIAGPSGLDTYVTIELPFPSSENPQKHSTEWARHTNEPTDFGGYQASARFEVNRKARSYERLLQGIKSLKITVYYNRGLLKKPAVLGTISVKLTELMANATHTGCYELMDGRKAAGGLLELRFRHRTPLLGTKFSTYEKPWLTVSTAKNKKLPN